MAAKRRQVADLIVLQLQGLEHSQSGERADILNQVVRQIQVLHGCQIGQRPQILHPVAADHQKRQIRHLRQHTDVADLIVPEIELVHLHKPGQGRQIGDPVAVEGEDLQVLQTGQSLDVLQTVSSQMEDAQVLHVGQRSDVRDLVVVQIQLGHARQRGERLEILDLIIAQIQPLQRSHVAQGHEVGDLVFIEAQAFQLRQPGDSCQVADPVAGQIHTDKRRELLQHGQILHPRIGEINIGDRLDILVREFTRGNACRCADGLFHRRIFPGGNSGICFPGFGGFLPGLRRGSLLFLFFLHRLLLFGGSIPSAQRRIRQDLRDSRDQENQQNNRHACQDQYREHARSFSGSFFAGPLLFVLVILFRREDHDGFLKFFRFFRNYGFFQSVRFFRSVRSFRFFLLFTSAYRFLFLKAVIEIRPLLFGSFNRMFSVSASVFFTSGIIALSDAQHGNAVISSAVGTDTDPVCQLRSAIPAVLNINRHVFLLLYKAPFLFLPALRPVSLHYKGYENIWQFIT